MSNQNIDEISADTNTGPYSGASIRRLCCIQTTTVHCGTIQVHCSRKLVICHLRQILVYIY